MAKKYWLHRISHEWEVSYPLFEKGYLSVGWRCFQKTDIIDRVRDGGDGAFNRFMDDKNEKSRSRWNLWRFAQFSVGDIIVVPLFDRQFAICEVKEAPVPISALKGETILSRVKETLTITEDGIPTEKRNEKFYDIGFVVAVEKLTQIPRSYANADLISRMKIRQANADISDLAGSVEGALQADGPVSIHDKIIEATTQSVHGIIEKYISDRPLEKIVMWYMKRMGADRVRIPAKNEKGKENGADADVIAEFDDLGLIFYIQVKNHKWETDDWAVKQVSEYTDQKKDENNDYTYIPWAVTTAEFSQVAIEKAKEAGVRLIGGKELIRMLINKGINDIDEALPSKTS